MDEVPAPEIIRRSRLKGRGRTLKDAHRDLLVESGPPTQYVVHVHWLCEDVELLREASVPVGVSDVVEVDPEVPEHVGRVVVQ